MTDETPKVEPIECAICGSDADCVFTHIAEAEFFCPNDSECPVAIHGPRLTYVEDWNAWNESVGKIIRSRCEADMREAFCAGLFEGFRLAETDPKPPKTPSMLKAGFDAWLAQRERGGE